MNNMPKEKLMLTVSEVAALLRISRSSAYEAVRRNQIPAVKFGRTIRIPRAALCKCLLLEGTSDEH